MAISNSLASLMPEEPQELSTWCRLTKLCSKLRQFSSPRPSFVIMLMRHTILIVVLIAYTQSAFSQANEKSEDELRFDEIFEVYYEQEYDSALVLFNQFIIEFPNSNLYPRAKYNIGYIYRELGNYDLAIGIFKDIINSNYNDQERFGGLMEQYTLYKHRSSKHLAEIYLDRNEYQAAIKYIRMFDKRYRYKHFCGNELYANEIYTASSYGRYYYGIGKPEKAIKRLSQYLFENGLASNVYLVKLLDKILKEKYTSDELDRLLSESKATLTLHKKRGAYIEFFGSKVYVDDYSLYAFSNPDFEENIELSGIEIYNKVIETNPIFNKGTKSDNNGE